LQEKTIRQWAMKEFRSDNNITDFIRDPTATALRLLSSLCDEHPSRLVFV
jgi:hypothetical protein